MGGHAHPEVSLHGHSMEAYSRFLDAGDWESVGDLMLDSAQKLAAAGAQLLVCPDNTIHQALPRIVDRSPLPWLHIAEVVASTASERGYRRVGVLGTRWLVDSEVYPDKLAAFGIEALRPTDAERDEIHRIIMDELVHGRFEPEGVAFHQAVIERMKTSGLRRGRARLHRDPSDHRRQQLRAPDPRLDAAARARRGGALASRPLRGRAREADRGRRGRRWPRSGRCAP